MFVTSDGRMLFLERSPSADDYPQTWCFPGGSIDKGEGPKVAAKREVREEVGYEITRLGGHVETRNGFRTYRVEIGGPFPVVLNDEHTRAVWARPADAPEPLHPGVRATLDRLVRPRTQVASVRITAAGRRLMASDARGTLDPIRPAAPTRIAYQKRLDVLIDEMANSIGYWLRAAYRNDTPATVGMAQDSAASILSAAFDKLAVRWLARFDALGPKMADWFVQTSRTRVDRLMKADLRKAGFTVKFQMSDAMRDAFGAVVDENIGLIKSIAEQHLSGVRVALMQSVQNGRDLGYLAAQLEKRHGVTKRRAALIARDQNSKATAVFTRVRAIENGITRGIWMHSAGGKVPRPPHVAFSGQAFDLTTGHDFDDGEGLTWPGVPISCRCVWKAIVPGFE